MSCLDVILLFFLTKHSFKIIRSSLGFCLDLVVCCIVWRCCLCSDSGSVFLLAWWCVIVLNPTFTHSCLAMFCIIVCHEIIMFFPSIELICICSEVSSAVLIYDNPTCFWADATEYSPHDVSLPLSFSSYPQSPVTLDHGETLQNYSNKNCSSFPLRLQVSFIVFFCHYIYKCLHLLSTSGFSLLFLLLCVLLCMSTYFPVHWCTSWHKGLVEVRFWC